MNGRDAKEHKETLEELALGRYEYKIDYYKLVTSDLSRFVAHKKYPIAELRITLDIDGLYEDYCYIFGEDAFLYLEKTVGNEALTTVAGTLLRARKGFIYSYNCRVPVYLDDVLIYGYRAADCIERHMLKHGIRVRYTIPFGSMTKFGELGLPDVNIGKDDVVKARRKLYLDLECNSEFIVTKSYRLYKNELDGEKGLVIPYRFIFDPKTKHIREAIGLIVVVVYIGICVFLYFLR